MTGSVLAFIFGVSVVQLLPALPPVAASLTAALALVVIARHRIVVFGVLGCLWALWAATERLDDLLPPALEGKDLTVEGIVVGLPQRFDRGVRFDFAVEPAAMTGNIDLPAKVRLSWYYNPAPVRSGQRWRLTVRLKRPHGMMNPGGFDYERWLFLHRIGATGYVRRSPGNRLMDERAGSLLSLWRQTLADDLTSALADHPMSGIIKALTIGERSAVTPDQWRLFRRTGTAHLMAISGLHIGLVAGLAFFVTRRAWSFSGIVRYPPPRVAAFAAFVAALFYAAIAGFAIPTRRALIMIAVIMGGVLFQRAIKPFHGLTVALLLIVLVDPFAVLSPGFWLSFAAVALILFALAGRVGSERYWHSAVRIQWVTALGLMPIVLLFFHQASLIAPIANLIAVPLISLLVVPAALAGVLLLTVLPSAGRLLLAAVEWVLEWLSQFLTVLSDLPFAQWTHSLIPLWVLPFACIGVLLLLSPRGIPGRWLGAVLLTPLIFVAVPRPDYGDVQLTLLDVGQGLSAVIRTAHHALVFDTGARYSDRFDLGSAVVAPFLRSQAVDKIDMLVVSHGDNDHIGGAEALLRLFDVEHILSSVPERMAYAGATFCRAGQAWDWDGVRFRMLSPRQTPLSDDNNNSCVLQIIAAGGTILLTGDIEQAAEQRLLQQYGKALASDVLVVPHHGSNTSSTAAFLKAVRPRYALVPAGYRNRYGFPSKSVMRRLGRQQSKVLNTANSGAIQVEINAQEGILQPQAYRRNDGKYYHHQKK